MNKLAYYQGYMTKLSEIIPGGKADAMGAPELAQKHEEDPEEIHQEVQEGRAVELEHTQDPEMAQEIAEDHVEEIPDYYERLEEMEEEAETEQEQELGDPEGDDTAIILNFIATQDNLDDDALHDLYVALGVDPHEGEEIVYAALQEYLQQYPDAIDPEGLQELETDEEEIGKEAEMTNIKNLQKAIAFYRRGKKTSDPLKNTMRLDNLEKTYEAYKKSPLMFKLKEMIQPVKDFALGT